MSRVLIVVDPQVEGVARATSTAELTSMTTALKQAISEKGDQAIAIAPVQIISADAVAALSLEDVILCPLTLNLPDALQFPGQTIYRTCQEVESLRQWVSHRLGGAVGTGEFWLPIILTAKGPLYAEVIGADRSIKDSLPGEPLNYYQPLHLPDRWRQPVYRLAQQLLRSLSAPPATYLLQFGFQGEAVVFDRLFPFPAAPAIASIGVQTPDLFACHWCCLTGQLMLNVTIPHSVAYRTYESTVSAPLLGR